MGKKSTPFYEGADHWLLYFNSNGRIEICDSLYCSLNDVKIKSLKALYKSYLDKRGRLVVTTIPVQKQNDCNSCGLFAFAFAVDILSGDSSPNSKLDPSQMQTHLLNVLRKWRSKEVS